MVADDYDDGGFSGGNMERPALKRLLADSEAGRIDIVVVYKIDRLSRSLADFARMVEVLDRCGASFSAVTQQINPATSMGRLMLNVLLSFAQFEREVTGERIRDKIAASKAKGMWMGGPLPLSYEVQNRLLVVNEAEAAVVRRIFGDFARDRPTTHMVRNYAVEGIRTKTGRIFCKQSIYKLLHNRMYLGEIVHDGALLPGLAPADPDLRPVAGGPRRAGPDRRGTAGSGGHRRTGTAAAARTDLHHQRRAVDPDPHDQERSVLPLLLSEQGSALRGMRKVVIRPDGESSSPTARGQIDSPMLVALARAFYWQQLLDDGVVASGTDIAQREGLHHSTVNELLRLTLLEPAIIQVILAGTQPRCMSPIWFQRNPLPLDWIEQRRVVDGFDA